VGVADKLAKTERWHIAEAGLIALAAAARSAIQLLASDAAGRFCRCANPDAACSWPRCRAARGAAPNICGKRARVARHYRRARTSAAAP
jgi:predicted RNA-binding Zn ribbon-like protein